MDRYWVAPIVPGVNDQAGLERLTDADDATRWCVVVDEEEGVIAYVHPDRSHEVADALNGKV